MKKDIIKFALLLLVAIGAGPASSQVYKWSLSAGSNSNADPHINWAEGQAPSSINDSARAMMAALAGYRDDISGSLTTGGIATAYTLATSQGLPATPTDGQLIAFTPNVTNGTATTLQADGGTAYALQTSPGVAVGAASLIAGTPYSAKFSLSNTAWILRDFYGNAFSIPLGGLMPYTLTTAPNSNFVFPAGQCLSTTTYATYWVALGSPASGSCPGGQFAIVDLSGRVPAGLDTMPGFSAKNRLTSASTGCGTAMTSVGAVCINGVEGSVIPLAQLPTGITSSNSSQAISVTSTQNALTQVAGSSQPNTGGGAQAWNGTIATLTSTGNNSISVTSNNTSGAARPNIGPIIGLTYLLRVI